MRIVNRSLNFVGVDISDRCLMAEVSIRYTCFSSMATCCVHINKCFEGIKEITFFFLIHGDMIFSFRGTIIGTRCRTFVINEKLLE